MLLHNLIPFVLAVSPIAFAQNGTDPDLSALANNFPGGKDSNSTLLTIQQPTGQYNVTVKEDPDFPNRTIYVPEGAEQAPLFAWENGMCYLYGRMYADFLTEIASHGYFVVAPGPAHEVVKGQTNKTWQTTSIDLALNWENAPFKIAEKVAAGGHSCGGGETVANTVADSRIATALILNSASFAGPTAYANITVPLLFIHGGPPDVAYEPAERDFAWIKANATKLPAFKAVLETGHLGSFWWPRGGIYAETSTKWLDWALKGVADAKSFFEGGTDSPAAKRGWVVDSSAL